MIDNSATNDRHEMNRLRHKEIRRLAQAALQVQDACNLSGVLRSAAEVASSLRTVADLATLEVNHHYIMRLFASKIADLAGLNHTWPQDAESDALACVQMYDTEGNRR